MYRIILNKAIILSDFSFSNVKHEKTLIQIHKTSSIHFFTLKCVLIFVFAGTNGYPDITLVMTSKV